MGKAQPQHQGGQDRHQGIFEQGDAARAPLPLSLPEEDDGHRCHEQHRGGDEALAPDARHPGDGPGQEEAQGGDEAEPQAEGQGQEVRRQQPGRQRRGVVKQEPDQDGAAQVPRPLAAGVDLVAGRDRAGEAQQARAHRQIGEGDLAARAKVEGPLGRGEPAAYPVVHGAVIPVRSRRPLRRRPSFCGANVAAGQKAQLRGLRPRRIPTET